MYDVASTSAQRWRPARAGIRNIWEYDDQVFDLADGRLVLRGPNGTGKSNALALLVPFLLDGVMSANRMDSLGGGRSMRSLLLCLADDEHANRFRHEQRTGYTWLEFVRGGGHLTIGCGARASTQRDAEAWFFVTPRRPGIDLDLAPEGVPLTRRGLVEILGADAVHDSAESYRAAVDHALFGLGPHRFPNLIELLLVLRRPHLAGKLNLDLLSKVLSDGLAALDDQLIADVAASFEDLEAVQSDLQRLQEAHRTVRTFLPVYQRYLRAVARTRALAAIEVARELRAARRRVAGAVNALAAADDDIERVRRARVKCEERREIAAQRQRAVLESPAYRDARGLVEVEGRTKDARLALDQAEERLQTALVESQDAARDLAEADDIVRQAATNVQNSFGATAGAADLAGVSWSLARDEVETIDLPAVVRGLTARRRQDVSDVRAALADADRAAANARATAEAAERAAEDAERAEDERRTAAEVLDLTRSELAAEVRVWVDASHLTELDAVLAAVNLVGEPGAPSLGDVVAAAFRPRREELAVRVARAEDLSASLSGEHDDLVAQRLQIVDDPAPAPDRLATRPADRTGRAGAPLYACCDFADNVAAADRASLEAAIEAAGLLDAWVGEPSNELDAWVGPGAEAPAPSLATVLVATPPAESEITAEAVREVLASISLAEAGISVTTEGRFRLGPLTGRFAKPEPEFIGATAREQRRLRLLAEVDARIAGIATRLVALEQQRADIAGEQHRLDEISESLPSQEAIIAARDALVSAIASAKATRAAIMRANAVARDARKEAEEEIDRLKVVAGERRLPTTAEELNHVDALVNGFDHKAGALIQAVGRVTERRAGRDRAVNRVARANRELDAGRTNRDERHRQLSGLQARVEQLRSQLGPDAQTPLRKLELIEEELRGQREEAERLNEAGDQAAELRGRAVKDKETAGGEVSRHESTAREAEARLEVLRRKDVWSVVAGEPTPPSDDGELTALVANSTTDITAEADDNALQRSFRQLLDELGRGHDPSLSYIDHVAVVEVTSDAGTFSVLHLAEELGSQVARQEQLLSERDREIFERHLLTRVSEALRELLNDADDLVDRINRSLADRPTASGKSVQLRWEIETADPAVRSAIGLLRKSPELRGPDETERLRKFFSTAIAQRRAEDASPRYAEILTQVLDYRSWHAFVPRVRSAGGGVQRLTRTLFRNLSGGEQAVVLHLPLFAAAAAHYDAAAEGAPRLIALDEAFAGIDEGMRGELMGLLVGFDLDVMLTGHELWGAYEQVPALMVYDLLRHPPLEGVSAFPVRWDGAAMAEV
jgi:uncharacterized protein (TIGR02680 family)